MFTANVDEVAIVIFMKYLYIVDNAIKVTVCCSAEISIDEVDIYC